MKRVFRNIVVLGAFACATAAFAQRSPFSPASQPAAPAPSANPAPAKAQTPAPKAPAKAESSPPGERATPPGAGAERSGASSSREKATPPAADDKAKPTATKPAPTKETTEDEPELSADIAGLEGGRTGPKFSLKQLLEETSRANPALAAARFNLKAAEAQLREAQRLWWPSFSLEGIVAPSVDIRCQNVGTEIKRDYCLEADVNNPIQAYPTGILTRWEIKMGFPVFTFGKLGIASKLAEQNAEIAERGTEIVEKDLQLNVRRAYYGALVAREVLEMVKDGLGRLEKAIAHIDEEMQKGKGRTSEIDRLRLSVAEQMVRSRALEAEKGEVLAYAALRTLVPTLPPEFRLDVTLIEAVKAPAKEEQGYRDQAREHRPEANIVRAGRQAAIYNKSLNARQFFPDFVLAGSYTRLWKTTDNDDPSSPYAIRPFAPFGYGGALVMRWDLDFHLKIPRYDRAVSIMNAAQSGEQAALSGIELEATSAYASVTEASRRMGLLRTAEKAAHSWLTAVAQNFALGTAEAREFNDALFAYFDAHGRYLQSIYDYNFAVANLWRLTGKEE